MKTTALVGSSTLLSAGINLVRAKAVAVILGPPGVALFGVYSSVLALALGVSEMGVSNSAVREVARASATGVEGSIGRALALVKRTALVLGLAGACVLMVLSGPVACWTFGTPEHQLDLAALSACVLLTVLANAESAAIRGMRRIRDLAAIGVLGTLLGTIATVPLILLLGSAGIVPSLVLSAVATLAMAHFYSRRLRIPKASLSLSEWRHGARQLVLLGSAFTVSAAVGNASGYLNRVLVVRILGLESAGQYQAAWSISALCVSLVLGALVADLFPRLSEVAEDREAVNRIANEQTEVSTLLAAPGIVATVVFAPIVLTALYSATFVEATQLLRWQALGIAPRLVSWPLAFTLLAQRRQRTFVAIELGTGTVGVALTAVGLYSLGLVGAGVAFLVTNLLYAGFSYAAVYRANGFSWPRRVVVMLSVLMVTLAVMLWLLSAVGRWAGFFGGTVLVAGAAVASLMQLTRLTGVRLPFDVLSRLKSRSSR